MPRRLPALLLALLASCVGTAVPQPPNLEPVDLARVDGAAPETVGGVLELFGGPGAAPADTEVWLWDLASNLPPQIAPVGADGSFAFAVRAAGALRLQVRDADGSRSPPVDVGVEGVAVLPLARPACLAVERELFLGASREASLVVVNGCDGAVTIGASRLRAGDAFDLQRPADSSLPVAGEATFEVSAPGDEPTEEILLVELTLDATTYLFPVTVSAPAR